MSMICDRLAVVNGSISGAREEGVEEGFMGWENQDTAPWPLAGRPVRNPRGRPWMSVEDSVPDTGSPGGGGGLLAVWRRRRD